MDFNSLPIKTDISIVDRCFLMTYKKINGRNVSFKMPLNAFGQFYISSEMLLKMSNELETIRGSLRELRSNSATKSYVETKKFLEKKDANYEKSKLLTEERLKTLLQEYCTKEKVEIDIENCKAHSRSVANSIANYLAIIAATSKAAATNNDYNYDMTESMINAFNTAVESMKEGEEEPVEG